MNAQAKDPVAMAQDSAGTVLLKALLTEISQLPKPWAATPERDQRAVIDRLRMQVEEAVNNACLTIAACGSRRVTAAVESVTFKDGVKAVLQLSRGNPDTHALADATGGHVLIVIADTTEHNGGMHTVKPEPDQRDIEDAIEEVSDQLAAEEDAEVDTLYGQVLDWVLESRITSVDSVQIQFKIDRERAEKIMAVMEDCGIVGPVREDNSREILDQKAVEHGDADTAKDVPDASYREPPIEDQFTSAEVKDVCGVDV